MSAFDMIKSAVLHAVSGSTSVVHIDADCQVDHGTDPRMDDVARAVAEQLQESLFFPSMERPPWRQP